MKQILKLLLHGPHEPVKIVSDVSYNVFGGTLNLVQSTTMNLSIAQFQFTVTNLLVKGKIYLRWWGDSRPCPPPSAPLTTAMQYNDMQFIKATLAYVRDFADRRCFMYFTDISLMWHFNSHCCIRCFYVTCSRSFMVSSFGCPLPSLCECIPVCIPACVPLLWQPHFTDIRTTGVNLQVVRKGGAEPLI